MKKTGIKELSERMGLPGDALWGDIRLTVAGKSGLIAENHGGILEYTDSRLVLKAGRGSVAVTGSGLVITAMNRTELVLGGDIASIELL